MPQAATEVRFSSALTDEPDSEAALDQAIEQLASQLSAPTDLVTVFLTAHHRDHFERIVDRLNDDLTPRVMMGVTAGGVVGVGREIEQGPGLSLLAATLPGVTLEPFQGDDLDWQVAEDDPARLTGHFDAGDDAKAMILLADPFSTPINHMLAHSREAWGQLPIVGGMASAATQAGGNRLMINGDILTEGSVGAMLSGAVQVDCTVSQGCRPIGRPFVITKCQRHLVQELGGRNALQVIQETIEDLDELERAHAKESGLLVGRVTDEYKERFGRGDFVIRNIVGIDKSGGYVAIADPQIRVGQTVQLHVRDGQTAEQDFSMLLELQKLQGAGAGALLFTCNGRGTNLFDEPGKDTSTIHDALGPVPLAGFFAAGEFGPTGEHNFVHGHTASLIVFRPEG